MRVGALLASTIRKLGALKDINSEQEALDIVSAVISKPPSWLYTHGDEIVNVRDSARVNSILSRRLNGEPLAYILGKMVFGDLTLAINRSVLIPRPATETLINTAQKYIALNHMGLKTPHSCHCERPLRERGNLGETGDCFAPLGLAMTNAIHIIEVGTGSGVIAVSLALFCRRQIVASKILATDISPAAVAVARRNITRYNLGTTINTRRADLLAAIKKPADIIVANLPYLSPKEAKGLADPRLALVGGQKGYEMIVELLTQIKHRQLLTPRGAIILEIGHSQAGSITRQAKILFPGARVRVTKDFEDWPRVLIIQTALFPLCKYPKIDSWEAFFNQKGHLRGVL